MPKKKTLETLQEQTPSVKRRPGRPPKNKSVELPEQAMKEDKERRHIGDEQLYAKLNQQLNSIRDELTKVSAERDHLQTRVKILSMKIGELLKEKHQLQIQNSMHIRKGK
jgi:septal ring factor EnvC (AmiA/AmiB activator)